MRRRITLLVAATTSVVLLAFLLPAAALVGRVAEARALDAAQRSVQVLVPSVGLDPLEDVARTLPAAESGGTALAVRWPDGRLVGDPVAFPADGPVPTTPLTSEDADGTRLAQPVRRADGMAVVVAFVPTAQLTAGVTRTRLVLAGLGAALLLVALAVADLLARSTTRPVRELATTAHRLGEGDLAARVVPGGPPEVRAVGRAVNQLAGRIGELLAAEREAAADLAHRLRTPLTALRLDAEGVPGPLGARLLDDVDALGRTVDELVAAARRPVPPQQPACCDAVATVGDRVRFWAVLAAAEGRPLSVELPVGAVPVAVARDDLAAAVDVLLGNVLAHTPPGTAAHVGVRAHDPAGGVDLVVTDRGPGLAATGVPGPAEALARGRSGTGSTGLGLDIARRTAEDSGGGLRVGSSPDGTTVTLHLGPPAG